VHFSDLLLGLEADVARAIQNPLQNGQHG